ncbi:hypothetical protein, variant 1 [Aphanomyces astaci]|nr:hypothetical protein, variant 1 [Aphanomyces astaci]ETV78141.1 hypothetical protein, variant 1 [Aphanomyces astaci]|eukprot:XP_009832480.1 hypothetical protein, variant 1 [Aphanomyces astaci]
MEGKAILTAKTKNLNELLLLKYESKKVIEVVDDIDFIDKAPSQIRHALGAKNATAAVDMYLRAFELVLSDKLAVFHAIASMRNALMECKQLIEDHIVQELESILFLQDVFKTFAKGLKQTVPVFQTLLAEADVLYTTATNTVSPPASIIGAMNTSGRPDTWKASAPPTANPLAMLVTCVKRLARQVDVSGTLKNTRRVQLDSVLTHVAALCQGKGYYEEATFGTHAASGNFETFVQVLAQVLEQLVRRHALLVECMDHGSCTLSDVLQSVFRLVQEQVGMYTDGVAVTLLSTPPPTLLPSATGLFRFAQLQQEAAAVVPPPSSSQGDSKRLVVCPASLFHMPVVYADLVRFSDAVQAAAGAASSYAADMLHPYLIKGWFPRLKAEAENFLARPTTRVPRRFDLSPPLDVPLQVPDVHVMLHLVDAMFDMLATMPSFEIEVAGVLEATMLRYVEECSAIVRKICDGTLNQLETGVAASELMRTFQDSAVYLMAKGKVPHQPVAQVVPTTTCDHTEDAASPGHSYGYSYALPTPILSTTSQAAATSTTSEMSSSSKTDQLQATEWEFEVKFKDPAFWTLPVTKRLLFDQGKLAMLAYINMACDAVSLHTEARIQSAAVAISADTLEHVLHNVKSVSWRCSGLADECLFFLRRELRLHAFYYLTQVTSSPSSSPTSTAAAPSSTLVAPHECIVGWNAHLMRMHLPLTTDKMAFVWDGLDRLEATIVMHSVQYTPKMTLATISQMAVNLNALQQNLTALLYGYPMIRRDFYHFERAKRYFQLLTLSETDLELFLMENRRLFPTDCLRAIWRVDVPTRVLTKSSVNKLDSLLR